MPMSRVRTAIILVLLCLAFGLGAVVNGHKVEAAPKKMYRCDLANVKTIQSVLDQRASEGWRLLTMSEGNQDGAAILVLVFEKE